MDRSLSLRLYRLEVWAIFILFVTMFESGMIQQTVNAILAQPCVCECIP
jgi:hypothetical protein